MYLIIGHLWWSRLIIISLINFKLFHVNNLEIQFESQLSYVIISLPNVLY